MGRKKRTQTGSEPSPRRGKRRSIRYEAREEDPRERQRELAADAPVTIHLRRLPAETALARLASQLQAFAGMGKREVLVVHGRGENSPLGRGVLGPLVRKWCDDHPAVVASWREAPRKWGGAGAIVVVLSVP